MCSGLAGMVRSRGGTGVNIGPGRDGPPGPCGQGQPDRRGTAAGDERQRRPSAKSGPGTGVSQTRPQRQVRASRLRRQDHQVPGPAHGVPPARAVPLPTAPLEAPEALFDQWRQAQAQRRSGPAGCRSAGARGPHDPGHGARSGCQAGTSPRKPRPVRILRLRPHRHPPVDPVPARASTPAATARPNRDSQAV